MRPKPINLTSDQWSKVETHILKHNEELGAIQKDVAVLKEDVSWLKSLTEKIDTRVWLILSTVVAGIIIQLFLRLWLK